MQTGVFMFSVEAMAAALVANEKTSDGFVKEEIAARHLISDLPSIHKH